MKTKKKLKPEGLAIIILTVLLLLVSVQDVVLFKRNGDLQKQVVDAVTTQQYQCETAVSDSAEETTALQAQIEQLKNENQILMQTNIELQAQVSQPQVTANTITTDDQQTTPEPTETPLPESQDDSGSPSSN